MNSLALLSRQLDLRLARQPQPPPAVPRVPTWSAFPPFRHLSPKRSSSSPALFAATIRTSPTKPPHHLDSLLRRVFFIRVFLFLWTRFTHAWSSLVAHLSARYRPTPILVSLPDSPLDRVKESPDEPSPSSAPRRFAIDPFAPPLYAQHAAASSTTAAAAATQPMDTPDETSRAATPTTRKPGIRQPKTLVLDLDETLIHSTSRPMNTSGGGGLFGLGSFGRRNSGAGHMVEVVLQGKSTLYHVYKRPFVDFFLRTVSSWYTLVIFTASMEEYADPVIDWLDAGRGILAHRFFRDSCTQLPNGSYTKDLSIVDSDLSRVCLIDNSPVSYRRNEANGIPIEGWTHDPSDEALLDLLPVLDSLRFTSDVRRVVGLRTAGLHKSAIS
ncbi:hypothetical protein AX15_004501 [Amanita polypyramis BW_CC]|nr:hypothetical protein AX15_004501 [Amanita polypyramis BW_CC]